MNECVDDPAVALTEPGMGGGEGGGAGGGLGGYCKLVHSA